MPNDADYFPKGALKKCRKMPKENRMHPENGQNIERTPRIPRKCLKFPASCRNSRFAYYAESIAGIFRLALSAGTRTS